MALHLAAAAFLEGGVSGGWWGSVSGNLLYTQTPFDGASAEVNNGAIVPAKPALPTFGLSEQTLQLQMRAKPSLEQMDIRPASNLPQI